jgi:hypothetical protein
VQFKSIEYIPKVAWDNNQKDSSLELIYEGKTIRNHEEENGSMLSMEGKGGDT